MSTRFINDGVRKAPPKTGGIGTENRVDIGRYFIFYCLEIFQDAASGPIDIRPLFENDVDEGTA